MKNWILININGTPKTHGRNHQGLPRAITRETAPAIPDHLNGIYDYAERIAQPDTDPDEGKYWNQSIVQDGSKFRLDWSQEDIVLTARTQSKIEIVRRIKAMGKWQAFKQFIKTFNEDITDLWEHTHALDPDDQDVQAFAPVAKAQVPFTDEEYDSLFLG